MENTNMQKNQSSEKKSGCPCMDMNKKYAKGFNDEDLIIEDDEEIDVEENNNSYSN